MDGDDNDQNYANTGVNFLVENMEDYFQDVTLADKTFDPNNHKHVMIKYIYEAFDFQEFQKIIQWGLDNKSTIIDAYIDYQLISNINNIYLESKKKQNSQQDLNESQDQDSLNDDHPLQIIATKIFDFQAFVNNATDIINSTAAALDQIRTHKLEKKYRKRVCAQFYNFDKVTQYQDIKANIVNQFISIKGIVLKTSPVKLMFKKLRFQCVDCKNMQSLRFKNGNYAVPTKCGNINCKSKLFTPMKSDPQNIVVQYQKLRVQEIEEGDQVSGRVPRYIDCELQQNLVSQVINGDNVIVNGILRTEVIESGIGTSKKNQGLYQNFLEVNQITNYKNDKGQGGQSGNFQEEEEFSEQDMNLINQLSESKSIFYLLIKSICPTIYGHELMKAGIIFAIIGGSNFSNNKKDENNIFNQDTSNKDMFRSDSHVLLIGDPGLGKSQMLKFVANITPRSVYVCGNATSNAGLTVSVSRDSSGEGTLEAGALILSDQGVCCIDEFDKMQDQHQALLEAMEQQTVSLAKSGVLCSLQCRASIIACANPIGGHYNKAKSIKENIKISNAVLSRFDLIFLMLDRPDPDRDTKLSKHIMKLHNNLKTQGQLNNNQQRKRSLQQFQDPRSVAQQNQNLPNFLKHKQIDTPRKSKLINDTIRNLGMQGDDEDDEEQQQVKYSSFSEKLQKEIQKLKSPILDPSIIRKYLQFAKKHICPILTEEATEVLKNFYITLRENNINASSMPITARQLESMIRLAQARAKVECRDLVTEQDAQDVVDLMYESLFDSLEDLSYGGGGGKKNGVQVANNLKNVDMNNIGTLSKPKQSKLFIAKLQQECEEKQDDMFSLQELTKIGRQMNMNVGDFRMYIEELNCKGTIIHKGNKRYQLKEKLF